MKLFLRWGRTRGPGPSYTHRIQAISAGMGEVYPPRAFPRDGPVPLRRTGVLAPPSGPATGKLISLRKPRFGPPYLTRRTCVFYARWTYLLTSLHHTHGASWAGLAFVRCETQNRHERRIGERCWSQWRFLASLVVGERPSAPQESPLDPLSPLRCPS